MRNQLIKHLARLASQDLHERFIRHGTKDSYVLPEELIDMVLGDIHVIMLHELLKRPFSDLELEALRRFDEIASATGTSIPWESATSAGAFLDSPEWVALRNAAAMCLEKLSVDIKELDNLVG
jgi:hypothetical protein